MTDIPKQTRQNIFDSMDIDSFYYGGELSDIDFLARLYDLSSMHSTDDRFSDAGGDIWQHCENNNDWPLNWVFTDSRFNLLYCDDDIFLKFLCETIHPLARPNKDEAETLLQYYREQLSLVGVDLVEKGKIAGRAIYVSAKTGSFHSQIDRAYTSADILSSNWMQTEVKRAQDAIESDPALAVGTAKDLVESCCKSILEELDKPPSKSDDLPKLTKAVAKELDLLPDGVSSQAKGADTIKRTLSNLVSLTKGIAELRGLYGSGHGKDGKHIGIEPRHARLAVSSAITFVDFVTETYVQRRKKPPSA